MHVVGKSQSSNKMDAAHSNVMEVDYSMDVLLSLDRKAVAKEEEMNNILIDGNQVPHEITSLEGEITSLEGDTLSGGGGEITSLGGRRDNLSRGGYSLWREITSLEGDTLSGGGRDNLSRGER